MATIKGQRKLRDNHRLVKTQLNVMARKRSTNAWRIITGIFDLMGKGEVVTFACFLARALIQRADNDTESARMFEDFVQAYHRGQDIHAA